MGEAATQLATFAAFLALYAALRRRATRRAADGRGPAPPPFWPTQALWLVAIAACAGVAIAVGALD